MFQIWKSISAKYVTKTSLVSHHSHELTYYFSFFSGYNEKLSRYFNYDFLVATLWLAASELMNIGCIYVWNMKIWIQKNLNKIKCWKKLKERWEFVCVDCCGNSTIRGTDMQDDLCCKQVQASTICGPSQSVIHYHKEKMLILAPTESSSLFVSPALLHLWEEWKQEMVSDSSETPSGH